MPPFIVRDATPEDAKGIAPLLDALGYPADVETITVRLRELSAADPTGRVLVAVDDDRLVGFAALHSTPVLHRATAVGRVTGIAVRHRSRALGSDASCCAQRKVTSEPTASSASK